MTAADWTWLAILGGGGALLRYLVDGWIGRRFPGEFPLGTFAINAAGSLALGLLVGLDVTKSTLFVFGTGLIGAFTTFSTWLFETVRLAEDGELAVAAANLAVSIAVGLAAGGAGWALGSVL